MYKFWTIQNKEVLDIIGKDGIYQPDFEYSEYLKLLPNVTDLYDFVLQSFNEINGRDLPGLVFGFAMSQDNTIYCLENYESFKMSIRNNKFAIESLWNHISTEDSVVLELQYEADFNPIFIDINDFQFLMPPIHLIPPYTEETFHKLCNNIANGDIDASVFPSNIIQLHLPNIKKENVVGIHPVFSLE